MTDDARDEAAASDDAELAREHARVPATDATTPAKAPERPLEERRIGTPRPKE